MSATTVRFGLLCSMFQAMARDRSPAKKRARLRTFLDRVYTDRSDYFAAIRLVLPSLDRERGIYGLKESSLALCLVEALGISKDSQDALRLVNWRKGGARVGANAGNFALIASEVLQRRQGMTSGGLKIKEVNDALDQLATKENRAEKAATLSSLIKKTNAVEMKWLLMIILKDLKLGISEKSIFNEFHPDAEDLFNVTCDLKLVCEKLNDRSLRHKRQDIEVGKAVRPQLAMRVGDAATAWKKLHGKQIVVECKFDGDRIQVHKNGSEINYFSRNFLDHSEYVHGMSVVILQNVLLDRCILDGEMLVWDSSTQRFAEFGSNQEIAKAAREGLASDRQLCYVAFDVLYVGDTSVIHQSLSERHDLLRKVVRPVKGRLEILVPEGGLNDHRSHDDPCWSVVANNLEDVERFFKQTVENRDEGIVIKDLGSKWEPSDRSGKWLKLKPDYIHPGADLDVLILGGYFGSGRRGGEVAQFLMGLAEPSPPGSHPKRFLSFCRVGTGLSDDELDSLVAKLKPYFRKNEHPKKPPRFYEVTNNSKERPDVWIESPDKSVILAITSDVRTIKSEVFAAPYSLRFPRILRVRYDKPWHECLDLHSFVELVHSSNGSMQGGTEHAVTHKNNSKRPKISKTGERKFPLVPSHFMKTDISNLREQSYIFANMMVYFANTPSSYSVEYFHKLVAENGGTFSMNINDSVTHCIAAEKKGIKYQAATRRGDVIHYSWVLDCCAQKRQIHLQPKYYLFITDTSKRKFQEEMDAFFDYYYWDLDDSDIKQIFSNMKGFDDSKAINYYQRKYCLSESRWMFQDCKLCFHEPFDDVDADFILISELASRRMKLDVLSHGGEIANRLERATHLIVYLARDWVKDFEEFYKSFPPSKRRVLHGKSLHILRHEWVEECVATGRKLPEVGYNLKPETFEAADTESLEVGETPHSSDVERPIIPTVPGQRGEIRRRGRPTAAKARKGSTLKPGRKRARIGSRAAKIDEEESENSGPSRDDINMEDLEKPDEYEQLSCLRVKGDVAVLPPSPKPQKTKHSSRVGRRCTMTSREELGGSSQDDLSGTREGSDKKIQRHKDLPHLGASEDPRQMKDPSPLHSDPSREQHDRPLNDVATSSGLNSNPAFDPVQAMLLDMIPSLSQREREVERSHEDRKPFAENRPGKEEQPTEDVGQMLSKKKKVSYKDVADELLKDWL